jgi:hypothetical protein
MGPDGALSIGVHAWDVKDGHALDTVTTLHIPGIGTDRLKDALEYRVQIR